MHYLLSLKENGIWEENAILGEIAQRKFESTLINAYSPYISNKTKEYIDAPKIVSKILKVYVSLLIVLKNCLLLMQSMHQRCKMILSHILVPFHESSAVGREVQQDRRR